MMNIFSSTNISLKGLVTALVIPGLLILSACGGGSGEVEKVQLASNKAPSVNAGQDQSAMANEIIGISASASDSDGTIESYSWTQISGTSVNLISPDNANASFTAPQTNGQTEIQLTFQITAIDDKGASATDSVTITVSQPVSNEAPVVDAGDDITTNEQSLVELNAQASDSDGTVESYTWVQTSGTNITLIDSNSANASFIAPSNTGQSSLLLVFQVTAIDNEGASATDSVTITVSKQVEEDNIAPTVNAGTDQNVSEQDTVELTAEAFDTDGSIASYSWSQISGMTVTLHSANTANAVFTAPSLESGSELLEFTVTVTDNAGETASDSVLVEINAIVTNSAPTISVTSPSNDASQNQDETTVLAATANDLEDGDISENIKWSSNIDGDLGTGSQIAVQLSQGSHIITASITDSSNQTTSENIDYNINGSFGVATFSWTAPTENTDNSQLTDLAGFKIYYGLTENELVNSISINSVETTSYVIENLSTEQTYFFAVTAVNELGVESEKSDISSKFIQG